ncbi:MAG: FecR domain-containing protein [Bacteroidales bacterium]|nr:FecR domain-containing protein [Bacteroidales bacterium]
MKETNRQLEELWLKYSTNTCNKEEFDRWLTALLNESESAVIEPFLKKKWDDQFPKTDRNKHSRRWYYSAAATLLLCLTFGVLLLIRQGEISTEKLAQATEWVETQVPISYVRLPDGSTVALRGNSRLDMRSNFEGNTREILLEGEAYFDIISDPNRPFIIHTGRIRTTVLGTAFAIKAVPGESLITITVAEGKVKVEDGDRLLTFLETDQQMIFDIEHEFVQELMIDVETEISWRPNELIFRNMSFGDIVQKLSGIYGIYIVFEDESLKQRRITTSLDRRESIETLLTILSAAQQSYHTFDGDKFIINSSTANH